MRCSKTFHENDLETAIEQKPSKVEFHPPSLAPVGLSWQGCCATRGQSRLPSLLRARRCCRCCGLEERQVPSAHGWFFSSLI